MSNYKEFGHMEVFFPQRNRKANVVPFEDVCQLVSNSDMLAQTETKQTSVLLCLAFVNP